LGYKVRVLIPRYPATCEIWMVGDNLKVIGE
jgi:hypothetical protein